MERANDWSAADVCSWFRGIGLGRYCDVILEEDVTGSILIDLAAHGGLGELGIERELDRARIRTRLPIIQGYTDPGHTHSTGRESAPTQGLIWAIGGSDAQHFSPVASVEMLDTRTGQWTRKPTLNIARQDLATVATSESLYVFGGATSEVDKFMRNRITSTVEQFDFRAGRWLSISEVPTCRRGLAAAMVGERIYTLGGQEGNDPLDRASYDPEDPGTLRRTTVELFDFQNQSWSGAAPLPTGREYLGVAAVGGKLYAIGGRSHAAEMITYAAVETMDIARGQWISGFPMKEARARFGMAQEGHAGLFVLGGSAGRVGQRCLNSVERLDVLTEQWGSLPQMPTSRAGLGAAVVGDNLYAIGGSAVNFGHMTSPVDKVEVLDLQTQQWMDGPPLLMPRHSLGVVVS